MLSVDGGGVRGIIPALVLDHLERSTGSPCAELFDLMVGTSTGGIIALALSLADEGGGSRYSANDLVTLYSERSGEIFRPSLWRRLLSLRGVLDETYSTEPLNGILGEYFEDSTMADCRSAVMVTAYDIENRNTVFLKSSKSEHLNVRLAEAARATSAAPTYFEPANTNVNGDNKALIDGGVYINSPAVSAYAEAMKLFPGDDITVVSLGTGELIRPIPGNTAAGWGSAGWILPLLDCMFDGASKAVNHQMSQFLGARYQRFQLSLESASDDMDDASEENLAALKRAGERLIAQESQRLDELVAYFRAVQSQRRPASAAVDKLVF